MIRFWMRYKVALVLVSLVIAIFSFNFSSCDRHDDELHGPVYSTIQPWHQDVEVERQYVAQIHAIQHIEIRAFEKGYLQAIYVDEGQHVKEGEKMFQIMPFLMQAEFKKAEAEYNIAKIEFQNTQKLSKKNIVSKNELALAKANFDRYAAELELAKTHLDLTTIKAPFDGIVDRFRVRLGSLVEEGELLTNFSDVAQLWVYFNLSEVDYLNYVRDLEDKKVDAKVNLILANGQTYAYPGHIDTVEAEFNNETGNIPFRATFDNPDYVLRHGETGNISLSRKLENALVIPQKATYEILDKHFVYVVDKEGTLSAREIEVAQELTHLFVVKSGITDADQILLEGLGKLSKGDRIRTKLITPDEAKKSLDLEVE